MEVKLSTLADYANTSADGKLNIMGIFSRINSANFPARHLQCHLVVSCLATDFDRGKAFPYRIVLQDPDGKSLMDMNGQVQVADKSGVHDINLNLRLNELVFPNPGDYQFLIDIGESKGVALPFTVTKIDLPNKGQ